MGKQGGQSLEIYFIEGLIIEVRHGFGKDHFTSRGKALSL